jgi:hypothetical protein
MKKMSIVLGAFLLPLVLWPAGLAGQQVGDNATIIVPTGKVVNMRQVVVVKGAPKAAIKVADCADGDIRLQDAEIVDREGPPGRGGRGGAAPEKLPTVASQVAIIIPGVAGFKELKPGWHLGSFRPGGKCGGYDIYLAHIIAIE